MLAGRLTVCAGLLAWGPDTMVIGFRGTQSMANIQQDIKVRCWPKLWRSIGP